MLELKFVIFSLIPTIGLQVIWGIIANWIFALLKVLKVRHVLLYCKNQLLESFAELVFVLLNIFMESLEEK